jgi:hypothetical protein
MALGRQELWPKDAVYVGMLGKAATHFGIASVPVAGFGKPWACLNDERGWRYAYAAYLRKRLAEEPAFREAVMLLHGKLLVCWCKHSKSRGEDPDCHADLLAHYAEQMWHAVNGSNTDDPR